jgi:vitamin B12 transporter
MKKNLSALIILSLIVFLVPYLQADDQNQPEKIHHEIVVTATRLETPVKETASTISVIKVELLSPLRNFQPEMLFSRVPGVFYLQTGSTGGTGSLFIRGGNSEHTLFMIDGIEINDPISPSRSFNFSLFNLSLIDRVEILRGPQSTLYGSDALAGVVNFVSAEPDKKGAEVSGLFGSLKTWQGNLRLFQSTDKFSYQVEVNSLATAGISSANKNYPGNSEPDGYNHLSLALKLKYNLRKWLSLNWQSRALEARADLDNFGGQYGDDPNYTQKTRFLFNRAELTGFFFNNRWQQKLIFGLESTRRDNRNNPDEFHPDESETGFYHGLFSKLDWQNNFYLSSNQTIIFGFEYKKESGRSADTYINQWGTYESNFPDKNAALDAFYAQNQLKLWNKFSITSGFRLDHHHNFGSALTYRIAGNLELSEIDSRIKATLGTGFKSPSLYQLYAPTSYYGPVGNPDLKPERNLGWDLGLEKNFSEKLLFSLTYFHTRYQNLIQFYFGSGYANIGKALTEGIEVSLNLVPAAGLDCHLSWTHLQAKDLDTRSQLLRRPRDTGYLSLNFQKKAVRSSVEFYYLGSRLDVDYSSFPPLAVKLGRAIVANVFLTYDLNHSIALFFKIDNLFNTKYELIYGYGTPGTTISTGFRLKLF